MKHGKSESEVAFQMSGKNEKQLLPVYLFLGADELKRETLLKRLMKRIEQKADLSLNARSFDASLVKDVGEVVDACNTVPFLSPLRLVTVKTVEKASKQLLDALIEYLKAPSQTTVLVLEGEKLAKGSSLIELVKKIDARAFINCSEVKKADLPRLVQNMAGSRGATMTSDAARLLIELIGTSTVALDQEVEKLVAFIVALGNTNIGRNDVNAVVAKSAETKPWELVDAFANRQREKAFELFNELSNESPISLLSLCVARMRDLISVKTLQNRGVTRTEELARELARPDWQIRRLLQASRNYSAQELRTLLVKAAEIDKEMKSGADSRLLFSQFLLEA